MCEFIRESIPYTATKPGHYCRCLEVLADRSLIRLSPERLCQSLTNTEVDVDASVLRSMNKLLTGGNMETKK